MEERGGEKLSSYFRQSAVDNTALDHYQLTLLGRPRIRGECVMGCPFSVLQSGTHKQFLSDAFLDTTSRFY